MGRWSWAQATGHRICHRLSSISCFWVQCLHLLRLPWWSWNHGSISLQGNKCESFLWIVNCFITVIKKVHRKDRQDLKTKDPILSVSQPCFSYTWKKKKPKKKQQQQKNKECWNKSPFLQFYSHGQDGTLHIPTEMSVLKQAGLDSIQKTGLQPLAWISQCKKLFFCSKRTNISGLTMGDWKIGYRKVLQTVNHLFVWSMFVSSVNQSAVWFIHLIKNTLSVYYAWGSAPARGIREVPCPKKLIV